MADPGRWHVVVHDDAVTTTLATVHALRQAGGMAGDEAVAVAKRLRRNGLATAAVSTDRAGAESLAALLLVQGMRVSIFNGP